MSKVMWFGWRLSPREKEGRKLPKRRSVMPLIGFGLRYLCVIGLPSISLTSLSAPARAGTIYTYDFNVSSFIGNNNPSLFGTAELTTISFNNGNSTNHNQIYRYVDIVGATVASIGGTFSITGSQPQTLLFTGNPSDTFATTDAQGMMELIPPFSVNVVTTDSVTISVNSGDQSVTLAAWWFTGTWQHSKTSHGDSAFGALSSVPEPSTLAMMLVGFALLGFGYGRTKKGSGVLAAQPGAGDRIKVTRVMQIQ